MTIYSYAKNPVLALGTLALGLSHAKKIWTGGRQSPAQNHPAPAYSTVAMRSAELISNLALTYLTEAYDLRNYGVPFTERNAVVHATDESYTIKWMAITMAALAACWTGAYVVEKIAYGEPKDFDSVIKRASHSVITTSFSISALYTGSQLGINPEDIYSATASALSLILPFMGNLVYCTATALTDYLSYRLFG